MKIKILLAITLIFLSLGSALYLSMPKDPCDDFEVYQRGIASWYGLKFQGKTMANGDPYNMEEYTVAHRSLPLGTEICIYNPESGKQIIARVTDRGPYVRPRIVDLSKKIADDIGITYPGTGTVEIKIKKQHSALIL